MVRPHKATRDQTLNETRERLLDAAAVEFAREGYVGANINRISTAAGFAKGTIYNYFDSKRTLLLTLIDEVAAAHVCAIVEHVESETDPVRRLEQFFRAGFDFVERHPARSRVVINMVYSPDETFKKRVYEGYQPLFDLLIEDIVGAGMERGDFRPADPGITAALVMTIYLGSCSQSDESGKIMLEPAHIMPFILDGLRFGSAGSADNGHYHLFAQG
jgi:AcrR family transcriptional regulator